MPHSNTREAVVVGGGLAGAAAAWHLAASGRDVLVLEREPTPHPRVCGEFLNAESLSLLLAMDIDACALGATRIEHYRFESGRRVLGGLLPAPAAGLSRASLDEACLKRAVEAGAEVRRGAVVTALTTAPDGGFIVHTPTERFFCRVVFWATGKHDVRAVQTRTGWDDDVIGVRVPLPLVAPDTTTHRNTITLNFFPDGYAGLNSIEGGRRNLSFIIRRRALDHSQPFFAAAFAHVARHSPFLCHTLQQAAALHARPIAITPVPYGHLRSPHSNTERSGVYFIGDQFAVLPSFWGSGMTLALGSARLAVACYCGRGVAGVADYEHHLHALLRTRCQIFMLIHRLLMRPPLAVALLRVLHFLPGLKSRLFDFSRLPMAVTARPLITGGFMPDRVS